MMTDVLTPEQRRRCMAAIKGRDTKPEMVVRRIVHGMGYRYRLHAADLPGKPDLVFRSRKKVIFVHGCFWHRHNCNLGKPVPATRPEFWQKKLNANRDRDRRNRQKLRQLGWAVLLVWECQTRRQSAEQLAIRLKAFLEG